MIGKTTTSKMYEEYRSLFSLPSLKKLSIYNILEAAIFSFLITLFHKNFQGFSFLSDIAVVIVYFFTYAFIVKIIVFKKDNVLDTRRTLGLSAASNGISLILIVIGIFLLNIVSWLANFFIYFGLVCNIFLTGLVIYTTAETSKIEVLIGASLIYIAEVVMILNLVAGIYFDYVPTVIVLVLGLMSIFLIADIPLVIAGHIGDVSGLDMTRGFIYAWVDKKVDKMEEVFSKISVERSLPIGLLRLLKDNDELFVVISNVHSGPFLNVGSSNMPYEVYRYFSDKYGIDAVVFHGTCTHSENLPNKQELKKFLEFLEIEREKIDAKYETAKVYRTMEGELLLTYKIYDNTVLGIVSTVSGEMDDLHVDIGLAFREVLRSRGLDGLLVDAHNSLTEPGSLPLLTLTDKIGKDIISSVRNLIEEKFDLWAEGEVEVGWHHVQCDKISVKEGLGPGGIWIIVEKIGERRFTTIIIDSNNLKKGFRNKILEILKSEKLIEEGEIITTDTHVVNAVSPGEGAYELLDPKKLDRLLPCIKEAIEKANEKLSPVKVGFSVKEIKIKTIGEDGVHRLLHAALAGSYAFKNVFRASLVTYIILLLLLSLLV